MIFFIYKRSKGLTMQIDFHSLFWSYLPRVPIFLSITVYIYIFFFFYWSLTFGFWMVVQVGIMYCHCVKNCRPNQSEKCCVVKCVSPDWGTLLQPSTKMLEQLPMLDQLQDFAKNHILSNHKIKQMNCVHSVYWALNVTLSWLIIGVTCTWGSQIQINIHKQKF